MPRVNGWKKIREDHGIANKHIWEHKEGMEFIVHQNRQEDGWVIVYPDGEEEVRPRKKEALKKARDYLKRHPLPEEKYGMFDDVMFAIVLPTHYNDGTEIPEETLNWYLSQIAERFGGYSSHPIEGGYIPEQYNQRPMPENPQSYEKAQRQGYKSQNVQQEDMLQIVMAREGEEGVPIKEDEEWLTKLGEQATEELGQAEIMTKEDPNIDIDFIKGEFMDNPEGTGFS